MRMWVLKTYRANLILKGVYMMKRLITAAVLLLAPAAFGADMVKSVARGQDITFTWDMPTSRESGEKITPADLSKSTIYWNCTNGARGHTEIKAPATVGVINTSDLGGDCEFRMTIADVEGRYSGFSDSIWRFIDVSVKSPPAATHLELAERGEKLQFKFFKG